MSLRRLIFLCLLLCTMAVRADIIVLQSGKEIHGTIVFQNEEVLVIKTSSGNRYQYPATEVKTIRKDSTAPQGDKSQPNEIGTKGIHTTEDATSTPNKVTVAVEIAGGAANKPEDTQTYGNMSANLLVGSRDLLGRGIFLGGSVGYIGALYTTTEIVPTTTTPIVKKTPTAYSFLPITLAARIPLLPYQHAPMIGMQVGYGIALSKDYQGGLNAGLSLGYCYRISNRQRLYVTADCQFQQAFVHTTESITDSDGLTHDFTHSAGQCFIHYGIRLGIYL